MRLCTGTLYYNNTFKRIFMKADLKYQCTRETLHNP